MAIFRPSTRQLLAARRLLTRLAVQGKVAASTYNQALSSLLFLYRYVLETEVAWLDELVHARRPQQLPVELTRGEVQALLSRLRRTHTCSAG